MLWAKDRGAECYYCPKNYGLAASWNVGMRRAYEDNYNGVIILAASAQIKTSLKEFIGLINQSEAESPKCKYLLQMPLALHCYCLTRRCVEVLGYFDENFWPIYVEDADYSYRSQLLKLNNEVVNFQKLGSVEPAGASLTCNKEPKFMNLWFHNTDRIHKYYEAKWGGTHTNEKFTHPFNNPSIGVNEWSVKNGFLNTLIDEPNYVPLLGERLK